MLIKCEFKEVKGRVRGVDPQKVGVGDVMGCDVHVMLCDVRYKK
jgi:hypothetical protein